MKIHFCKKHPCLLRDKECSDILNNGFVTSISVTEKLVKQDLKKLNENTEELKKLKELYEKK